MDNHCGVAKFPFPRYVFSATVGPQRSDSVVGNEKQEALQLRNNLEKSESGENEENCDVRMILCGLGLEEILLLILKLTSYLFHHPQLPGLRFVETPMNELMQHFHTVS